MKFNFTIDSVKILDRALTQEEIRQEFERGLGRLNITLAQEIGIPLDNSLVLNMHFNSNSRKFPSGKFLLFCNFNYRTSSNRTYDSSLNNNDGTCYGVTGQVCNWTSGKFGSGIQFDGTDDVEVIAW